MATREEVYAAIRQQSAAGNHEGVLKLSEYLKTMDAAPAAPASGPSATDTALRYTALGGRAVAQGVIGTLASPYDLPATAANIAGNLSARYLGPLANKIPGVQQANDFLASKGITGELPTVSGITSDALDAAGAYSPETPNERGFSRVVSGTAGALTGIGAGRSLLDSSSQRIRDMAQILSSNPVAQTIGAGTGATSAELAQRAGAGPVGQMTANVVGGMVPYAGPVIKAGVRGVLRGGDEGRKALLQTADDFKNAGTTATAGQAGNRTAKGIEDILSKLPFVGNTMRKRAAAQGEQIVGGIDNTAGSLAMEPTAEMAGRGVNKAFTQDNGVIDQIKSERTRYYGDFDKHVSGADRVDVSNTKNALNELDVNIETAPALSKVLSNSRITTFKNALESDANVVSDTAKSSIIPSSPKVVGDGKLPYEALKKLRTQVGAEMDQSSIAQEAGSRDKLRALYAAISKDMEGIAKSKGSEAIKSYNRANAYFSDSADYLHNVAPALDKLAGGEKIYNALMSGTKDGATVLREVMIMLPPETRKLFAGTVIKRLARSAADSTEFSNSALARNWGNLSKEAKDALFFDLDANTKQYLTSLNRVSKNIATGPEVFRDPAMKGSIRADIGKISAGGATAGALFAAPVAAGTALATSAVGAPLLAKWMTGPNAVNFLGRKTQFNNLSNAAQIQALQDQFRQKAYENKLAK